jgi:mannosyltransferase OCH1-like enzyme
MIPKILHYVWVGNDLPEKQRALIETWRRHNPDFKLVLWDERKIDFSIPAVTKAYRRRQWATVADIVRLSAVLTHGGIYLDTDFDVCRSFDPLLADSCFFGFQEESHPTDWVNNGLFGAVPGHWFIRKAYERILAIRPLPLGLDRPTKYGPKLITKLLREEGLSVYSERGVRVKDIFIHPTQTFYPFRWDEPVGQRAVSSDTYAVHLWERSWQKDMPRLLLYAAETNARIRRALSSPAKRKTRAEGCAVRIGGSQESVALRGETRHAAQFWNGMEDPDA